MGFELGHGSHGLGELLEKHLLGFVDFEAVGDAPVGGLQGRVEVVFKSLTLGPKIRSLLKIRKLLKIG